MTSVRHTRTEHAAVPGWRRSGGLERGSVGVPPRTPPPPAGAVMPLQVSSQMVPDVARRDTALLLEATNSFARDQRQLQAGLLRWPPSVRARSPISSSAPTLWLRHSTSDCSSMTSRMRLSSDSRQGSSDGGASYCNPLPNRRLDTMGARVCSLACCRSMSSVEVQRPASHDNATCKSCQGHQGPAGSREEEKALQGLRRNCLLYFWLYLWLCP